MQSSCRIILITVCLALLSALISLPSLSIPKPDNRIPVHLGRINQMDVYYHIGDIAIPNQLIPSNVNSGYYTLSHRMKFWDTYIISAPVPRLISTPTSINLEIPWTLLPQSVSEVVSSIDSTFGADLAPWLAVKESIADWSFDRISYKDVPDNSHYYAVTGVRRIYAVNLFEFVQELGTNYRNNLSSAISSATKEVIEAVGRSDNQRVALPALAAAKHVIDDELVVSYKSSFSAILDGLNRVSGGSPSHVVLVLWHLIDDTPEFKAAIRGLRKAIYRKLPDWKKSLEQTASILAAIGLIVGVLFSHLRKQSGLKPLAIVLLIGLLPIITDYFYMKAAIGLLPISNIPQIEIAILTGVMTFFGMKLHEFGVVTLEKSK